MKQPVSMPSKQHGVVLIACLLVVVVVTLIASAVSRTSGYEEKMAANAQNYNRTFQAAETAVETGVDDEPMMFEATDAGDGLSNSVDISLNTPGVTATVQTEFLGEGIAPGNSIGTVSTFRYEVHAEGRMTDMNANTLIRQGFYRVSFVSSTDD